jgi:hypothetical protein
MAQPNAPTSNNPARQTGEENGRIKQPQQTDATMAGKDLPRGSEKETHARK